MPFGDPIFDVAPVITSDGLLQVSGHYATKPIEFVFAFRYIYEAPEWKLFSVDVNLRDAPK